MSNNPNTILRNVMTTAETNPLDCTKELKKILLKIAENILRNPENPTYQLLKKTNPAVSKKILSLKGGHELLECMGFIENDDNFTFDMSFLKNLQMVKTGLENWKPEFRPEVSIPITEEIAGPSQRDPLPEPSYLRRNPLPTYVNKYTNPFLRRVADCFHNALIYNDKELKAAARSKIPVEMLELNAMKKMRDFQKASKEGKVVENSVAIQDFVLVELLDWFRGEFFEWVDTPFCNYCCYTTKFSHTSNDKTYKNYTERTEVYKCLKCDKLTSFHRFNDLNILLITKKGRCGEWANVFTLMCYAMGWEARYVLDETDHVWTEVYSPVQQRWLHCDPCEAICDKPLIYEHGWRKNLSYVMAYSPFELQDVTWRYSSKHKEVLGRRKLCSEDELTKAIVDLRNERIKQFSQARQFYIIKRTLSELSELMIEREPQNEEKFGRMSGCLDWRIARGEVEDSKWEPHVFLLFDGQLVTQKFKVTYSCALDRYDTEGECFASFERWSKGVYDMSNIIRKVENDWKQVYLCRSEGETVGHIAWSVQLRNTEKRISTISLKMSTTTFEDGKVDIKISGDCGVSMALQDNYLRTNDFKGSESLLIEVNFSGGKGDTAWQHAQLFRQPIDSKDFPFELFMTFD